MALNSGIDVRYKKGGAPQVWGTTWRNGSGNGILGVANGRYDAENYANHVE
jgi:hypothetical protein